MTLDELHTRMQEKVKNDPDVLEEPGRLDAIKTALNGQYSTDFPKHVVMNVSGTGDFDYPLPTFTGRAWSTDQSIIKSIEYPVGRRPESLLETESFTIYKADSLFHGTVTGTFELNETITGGTSGATATIVATVLTSIDYLPISGTFVSGETITGGTSGATAITTSIVSEKLRFYDNTPATTEAFKLKYTIPWTMDLITELNTTEQEALVIITSAYYCDALGRFYAQTADGAFDVDTVDYGSKSTDWNALADILRKQYRLLVGKDIDNGIKPASVQADWDENLQIDRSYLTHNDRPR